MERFKSMKYIEELKGGTNKAYSSAPVQTLQVLAPIHGSLIEGELAARYSMVPEGAAKADKAEKGWSSAWSKHYPRAGKSARRSGLAGSARGATRGQKYDPTNHQV